MDLSSAPSSESGCSSSQLFSCDMLYKIFWHKFRGIFFQNVLIYLVFRIIYNY